MSVWAGSLSLFALPGLLTVYRRHGRFGLHCFGATWDGWVVAWLLRRVGILVSKAERVQFTWHLEKRDDPTSANYLMAAVINDSTDRFLETHRELLEGFKYPDDRVRSDRVLTNLRKAAAHMTYELLGLVQFARHHDQTEGMTPHRLVILSDSASLAVEFPQGWAGEEVDFICPWNERGSLFLRLGRAGLKCLAASLRRRRPPSGSPSSVGVQVVWPLDRNVRLNGLFWWWGSDIDPSRMVLMFDRSAQPAGYERVSEAEQLGIRCVVSEPGAVGDSPHLLWRPSPGPMVSVRRLWRNMRMVAWGIPNGKVGRWIACRAMDMMHYSDRQVDLMEEFNLGAVLSHQDTGMDFLSLACDVTGAARIGFHWSHIPRPMAFQARLHQVYFAWGRHHVEIMEASGSCVDQVLLSGCIVSGAHLPPNDHQSDSMHRPLVTSNGASRVLALLDTSGSGEAFYEFFLERIIQNPRWGMLIKSKNRVDQLPWMLDNLPELKDMYERALATGRATMLDSQISPAEAAASADFAVGLDINSAAVVAALAGHRAIHLDYLNISASPFSEWANFHRAGADRLVFNDPEKLWAKLNEFFDEPGSEPGLGVMDDDLLAEIDPFRDGGAGKRIGDYIRWYLEASDKHIQRDQALELASRRYADKWGENSVIKGLSADREPEILPKVHPP